MRGGPARAGPGQARPGPARRSSGAGAAAAQTDPAVPVRGKLQGGQVGLAVVLVAEQLQRGTVDLDLRPDVEPGRGPAEVVQEQKGPTGVGDLVDEHVC